MFLIKREKNFEENLTNVKFIRFITNGNNTSLRLNRKMYGNVFFDIIVPNILSI